MKVLVTGASGMLGSALCPELQRLGHQVTGTDFRPAGNDTRILDISDPTQVNKYALADKWDVIFHLAAETDLDVCEKNPEHAYRVNTQGTANIARVCREQHILMVYISTSSVFDGEKLEPYIESDKTNPINVYGRTKLEGEKAVQELLDKYFIFRASWMIGGGPKDKKFVGKIIGLIKDGAKEIRAVDDKIGSPTFTDDVARNLMPVILKLGARYGIYHLANKGSCSRYELAKKIVAYLNKESEIKAIPVSSAVFHLPARRLRSEMLDNYRLEQLGLNNMPHWEESLKKYLALSVNPPYPPY